ncbi:MAG: hypothetical protein ACYC25_15090 [Paludibacter sp.]|jgi:hypothetical protein
MIHNFELSLHHEHEQTANADAFYREVLHVTNIKRFNSDSVIDLEFQRQDVDVLIALNGIDYRVSEKFRDKDFGDMYLEVYSKYPKTPGWLHTGTPNAILYFTPKSVYWITHKSLTSFCFTKLFPLIPEDWYLDIFRSHKPFISKQITLNQKTIKVNLIQAHNSLPDGSHWETIGITIAFEVLEQQGVQIRKYANFMSI